MAKNNRERVKECIEQGNMTKAEIAEHLGLSMGSVGTNMSYLGWMDLYIYTNPETKVLSFISEDEYTAWQEEKKANKKTRSTSTKSPEERAEAVAKTLANQQGQLAKWQSKLIDIELIIADHPEDTDALLSLKEAEAQIALFEVKIARNEAQAASLPEVEEANEAEDTDDLL